MIPSNDDDLTADALLARYKAIRRRLTMPHPLPIVRTQRLAPAPDAPALDAPAPAAPAPDVPTQRVTLRGDKPSTPKSYNVPNWRGARKVLLPVLIDLGVTWRDIVQDDRHRPYVMARRQVYHALHEAGWSYSAIGTLCLRDHSTVLYAVRMWRAHLADPTTKPDPQTIKKGK